MQLFSRREADGETILMAAALHARLDLVHLFLDIGALPWAETLGRHSPPMNAIGFAKVSPCVFVHSKNTLLTKVAAPHPFSR